MCKDLPCPGACGYWGINLWWKEKWKKREVPAQTPGDSTTIPSICDWQARRLARFNSLINFINHLLLKNSGTQISPWALSGPPAEHTQPACPHALWHTGHTLRAMHYPLLQHFKRATICFIYLNTLGLHIYILFLWVWEWDKKKKNGRDINYQVAHEY